MKRSSRSRRLRATTAALACGALVVAACTGAASSDASPSTTKSHGKKSTTAAHAVPGAEWQTTTPAAVGLDAGALNQIAAAAQTGKSNCVTVVRDGKIAGQWNFGSTTDDSTQDIFSATKSITSILVGIAQDEGDLKIDQPASKWIPEWKGTPSASVTIRDLLSNDSGRQWSPTIDYRQLINAPDQSAFAVGLGQDAPPGQIWAYNNSAIQTLQLILQKATGQDVAAFAEQHLFEPLGMSHTAMGMDKAGNAQTYEGVRSTCQDLARFGTLLLNHGKWGKHQIVSSAYVDAATGHSSTLLNAAYGYLFWLNRPGTIASPLVATSLDGAGQPGTTTGQIVPDAPQSMYWALGLGNQLVQVDPGSGTVVVRLGKPEAWPKPPTFGPAEASKVVTQAVVH